MLAFGLSRRRWNNPFPHQVHNMPQSDNPPVESNKWKMYKWMEIE
jgi:hypothetical protein